MESLVESVIQRIAVGPDRSKDISSEEAQEVAHAILAGEIDDVQAAVILISLRMKRETLEEFRGLALGVQNTISHVDAPIEQLFQLADPYDGYLRHLPMSPFLPAVLSACGLNVVLCGVESVGPKYGITAHKVYRLAGVDTELSTQAAADQIAKTGWAYLDQSHYCPALHELAQLRNRIIKRTAFTTLERVLMPIRARQQTNLVLGYVHKAYPEIYAEIAQSLGFSNALLVKGLEGGLTPAINKPLRKYMVDFNSNSYSNSNSNERLLEKVVLDYSQSFSSTTTALVAQGQQKENVIENVSHTLALGLDVLSGKQGAARDSLCLAAANILQSYQIVSSFEQAVEKVRDCLDNGSANQKFQQAIVGT